MPTIISHKLTNDAVQLEEPTKEMEVEEGENLPPHTNETNFNSNDNNNNNNNNNKDTVKCTSSAVVFFNNPTYLPSGSASPTYSHSNMSSSNVSLVSKTSSPPVHPTSTSTSTKEAATANHLLPQRSPSPLSSSLPTGCNHVSENEKTPTINPAQAREQSSEYPSSFSSSSSTLGTTSSQHNHMTRRKLFNDNDNEEKSKPDNSHSLNTSINTVRPPLLPSRTPPPLPAKPSRSPAKQEIKHQNNLAPPSYYDTVENKSNNENLLEEEKVQEDEEVEVEEEEGKQQSKETEPNTTLTSNLADEDADEDEYDYFEIPGLPDIDEDTSKIRLGLKGDYSSFSSSFFSLI